MKHDSWVQSIASERTESGGILKKHNREDGMPARQPSGVYLGKFAHRTPRGEASEGVAISLRATAKLSNDADWSVRGL